jgi:hypothetical protein
LIIIISGLIFFFIIIVGVFIFSFHLFYIRNPVSIVKQTKRNTISQQNFIACSDDFFFSISCFIRHHHSSQQQISNLVTIIVKTEISIISATTVRNVDKRVEFVFQMSIFFRPQTLPHFKNRSPQNLAKIITDGTNHKQNTNIFQPTEPLKSERSCSKTLDEERETRRISDAVISIPVALSGFTNAFVLDRSARNRRAGKVIAAVTFSVWNGQNRIVPRTSRECFSASEFVVLEIEARTHVKN